VHRAHVSTSPSDFAVDLFYVTDMRNELPQPERFKAVQDHVTAALQDPSSRISLHPAPVTNCRCVAAIPCDGTICGGRRAELEGVPGGPLAGPPVADARAAGEVPTPAAGAALNNAAAAAAAAIEAQEDVDETGCPQGYYEAVVSVDNLTSRAHTVLQVRTHDRKGLLYDSLRATKDLKVNVSYGKVCWLSLRPAASRLTRRRGRWRCAATASASWTSLSAAPPAWRWRDASASGAARDPPRGWRQLTWRRAQAAARYRASDGGKRRRQGGRRGDHGAVRHSAHGCWWPCPAARLAGCVLAVLLATRCSANAEQM